MHEFVGVSSVDDDGEVTSLEAITVAELIGDGDDLPQDDGEIEVVEPDEENVGDPVEETEEQ